MRAILINPVKRTVESYTIDHRLASLQAAVGGNIAWGTELQTGDVLYIDDEGLLKPNPAFFSLGRRSFAGRGLLVGPERPHMTDVVSTVEEIAKKVRFGIAVDVDKLLTAKCMTFETAEDFFEYLRRQRDEELE
ncbi:DUF3846 domain-containing protein [Bradyrhizobium sp. CCH5-F6]|jgi:hypothetical protein|uniref:DUF3846 domain-containing protein n=1 Tax=Bradyrhizobium sp. CCH5-F6 TaxID=1768753 RepID=UPI000769D0BE|nr:DUF3846 domain-containing protein [Bradyrhizobium sp. CCH5-F6]